MYKAVLLTACGCVNRIKIDKPLDVLQIPLMRAVDVYSTEFNMLIPSPVRKFKLSYQLNEYTFGYEEILDI
jgi:hypothetical protein